MSKFRKILLLLFLQFTLLSCMNGKELKTVKMFIGNETFIIELAKTDKERRTGLMNRKTLEENRGMLFVFEDEQKRSFWMKNTYIPLSIAYISKDGIIKEIYDMEPLSLEGIKSKYSIMYALELNKGKFKELNVKAGDKIRIEL